ncbi:PXA domain-containing protein [Lasiosphaeria miniovina]|uniref:PXA domain-containing protein n=1 Tax=Lasiosphaeria miniovina TaxID=1954250 RepID=A0AA40E873_9PEZI|nr:PXA domain-containing protein [Lasiosphaeria miniovina]KAK0728662.1 PXA domain-containing protein [Lasiosphaeria miniovina]
MTQEDAHTLGATPDNMEEKRTTDADAAEPIAKPELVSHSPALPSPQEEEDFKAKIFQFLATATPGTLGGVAAALAAVTYFILGQIGLVLIGAFGGILLFVQWEQRNAEVSRIVQGERGIDILARLLDARKGQGTASPGALGADDQQEMWDRAFDEFEPETREALDGLVDAVVRDYIKWWYAPIVPSDKFFPLACRKTLTSFISTVAGHLSRKRPVDAFLDFLTNSSSIVIVFFSELSNVFSELPSESKLPASDAVYNYLVAHPDSNLSNLLNERQQAGKFRMVAEDILGFLDKTTYECDPAKVFLREILAGVVLEKTLQTCSKPEWINSWIVHLLEAGEPDFSQVIDEGMQTRPSTDITFADIDGNVGNIGLTKGNRNSFEMEKARRKESMVHKKKLSKAEEEMEMAMEEVKRLNQMIEKEDARRTGSQTSSGAIPVSVGSVHQESRDSKSAAEASERLADAFKRNADELDIQNESLEKHIAARREQHSLELSPRDFAKEARSSDSASSGNDIIHTPLTPHSPMTTSSQEPSPTHNTTAQFTHFSQIAPPLREEAESVTDGPRKPAPLTLHNATITVLDEPGDKGRMKARPTWDYLVQIEPATSDYPGWMIIRKYTDFERLHEVLRRIAAITGASAFTEQHNALPSWKVHTRSSLRGELERYVRDACWYQSLAESEGMKRFLERDQANMPAGSKMGFQAIEKLGKNVFDVLTSAPMEGSKAVVGGVTGMLGNIGLVPRKAPASVVALPPTPSTLQDVTAASRLSMSTLPRADSTTSINGSRRARDSMDSQQSSVVAMQPTKIAPMERRPSYDSRGEAETESVRLSRNSARNSREHSRASSLAPARSPSALSLEGFRLPPPPDTMPDDYQSPTSPALGRSHEFQSHSRSLTMPALSGQRNNGAQSRSAKQFSRLSEQETRVAVELLFAVINELYTLSSAWNIRRTLLAAAKSFLLRPGNPSLLSIQNLIQSSVIDANVADSALAAHFKKLRENVLPTEQERAAWPAEMSSDDKEKLRVKARKLLIESGVPAALMGVMGQAATSDALGRLFDCLQVEEVARGLMFGIMLQAVRTITH